jgi:hypothetical protein
MNEKGHVTGREDLVPELKERVRDVRQGPDGWIVRMKLGRRLLMPNPVPNRGIDGDCGGSHCSINP